MTRKTRAHGTELRRRAEERLLAVSSGSVAPNDLYGALRLVHELEVHQVELELQREELETTGHALEAALARYTALYDQAPVGYLTLDARGRIHDVNLAAAGMLGVERGTLVGRDFGAYVHATSRETFSRFLAAGVVGAVAPRQCEVALQGSAGALVLVHLEGRATAAPGEPPGHCRVAMADVSELRRIEARALQAEKLEAIAVLAAGVAHEINNPLAYLLEGMGTLRRELESNAPDLAELRDIARAGCDGLERIRDVVRALGAVARPPQATRTVVEVGPELAAALRLASNEMRHRARVVTHLAPMPAVLAHAHELGQVFLNLLINAAQACPESGGDRATITVTTATDPTGWAVIEIADTGCGMSPEVMARIYDPYFTTKPRGLGTGLGLAMVHGAVTAAGGRIELTSREGEGSTFRVLLPPAERVSSEAGARAEAVVEGSPVLPIAGDGPVARPPVMVVDDEPQVARSVARSLGSAFEVTVCGSGPEALCLLERGGRFDAVVCDLMMPGMSGQSLQRRVAARWPDLATRFVFLTGGAFGDVAMEFKADTAAVVLEKPFDSKVLQKAVRQAARPRSNPG